MSRKHADRGDGTVRGRPHITSGDDVTITLLCGKLRSTRVFHPESASGALESADEKQITFIATLLLSKYSRDSPSEK